MLQPPLDEPSHRKHNIRKWCLDTYLCRFCSKCIRVDCNNWLLRFTLPWFLGFKLSRIHRFEIWRSLAWSHGGWGVVPDSLLWDWSLARCGFYGQKEEYDNDTMPLSVKVMLMEGIGCTGWTWTWCWKVVVDSADLFNPSCPKNLMPWF